MFQIFSGTDFLSSKTHENYHWQSSHRNKYVTIHLKFWHLLPNIQLQSSFSVWDIWYCSASTSQKLSYLNKLSKILSSFPSFTSRTDAMMKKPASEEWMSHTILAVALTLPFMAVSIPTFPLCCTPSFKSDIVGINDSYCTYDFQLNAFHYKRQFKSLEKGHCRDPWRC